ncbi:hypothetical protein BY458DRAFT_506050 [Sporodiniella umbellata]|nr:hypothetical protein BY458DRAFT_506050 [Sporodiniella umbellata]
MTISPKHCSVVVYNESQEDYLSLLSSTYKTVIIEKDKERIFRLLLDKPRESLTVVLIDAESCEMMRDCPDMLLSVVEMLKEGRIQNVVPIICSVSECPHFMVQCIHHGAADYILKPPSEDVIKTLFLNVTRYTQLERPIDYQPKAHGKIWLKFKERLKSVFLEETWLSKLIADYYTPKPTLQRSSMHSMMSERREYLKAQICSWDFLPLDLEPKDLIEVVFLILDQVMTSFKELEPLIVPSNDLYHFIFDVCNSYHSTNPYHNFRHAVDVLQANYYFLCRMGLVKPMYPTDELVQCQFHPSPVVNLLSPLDIFALLMASIGHDVGHPGVNNKFMVTTSTPLAILYNDTSVLESFHAMSFFHLLQTHCFHSLTDPRASTPFAAFRKVVVNCILATDMGLHDDYVQKVQKQSERLKGKGLDPNHHEKEKIIFCAALIKCADISNCARQFHSAKQWALVLAEEFFEQGDLEKEFGLNVLPMNDRGKIKLEDFQLGFKKHVALKLFQAVSSVTQDLQFTVDIIHKNIDIWQDLKQKD